MNIVVTGAEGRLGGAMTTELTAAGHNIAALGRSDLDITNGAQVSATIERLRPEVILNCSAYNSVDEAEANPGAAFSVNAQGPSHLATAARRRSALFVHFSSDFVFDGTALAPYLEHALTNPLSVYGASKLAGEVEASRAARFYVLRLESNFGGSAAVRRPSTVDYLTDGILGGLDVRAFVDRTVSPSYVVDVATATNALIACQGDYGVYHCVNSGFATWYDLAAEIARLVGVPARITPSVSNDLTAAARRPRFCALSNGKLSALGINMPTWQSAIERYLLARNVPLSAAVGHS